MSHEEALAVGVIIGGAVIGFGGMIGFILQAIQERNWREKYQKSKENDE